MKIHEISNLNLNESYFKLNPNSITVKGTNNKTKAVINDIRSVRSLHFSKKAELNVKYNGKLNNYSDNLYIGMDNALYYFIDNNHHKVACELANNGYPDEINKLLEKVKFLSSCNVNVIFVNLV
ncbi:hypothetical protein EDM57_05085 [Brevibacillus gelatini]|uniref:Uncharacterized protein n=1 Tax=Brevibacillus gelatini TaxID=1655277 RepID=A0A3M8B962_9BACL|nr:hypothetical protein [Brevibacillus gelatini]RNB59517.1 hypothetical protein EDM57_05085 [Brevibacillus gelatini]